MEYYRKEWQREAIQSLIEELETVKDDKVQRRFVARELAIEMLLRYLHYILRKSRGSLFEIRPARILAFFRFRDSCVQYYLTNLLLQLSELGIVQREKSDGKNGNVRYLIEKRRIPDAIAVLNNNYYKFIREGYI